MLLTQSGLRMQGLARWKILRWGTSFVRSVNEALKVIDSPLKRL
jgi:hypothetical protein